MEATYKTDAKYPPMAVRYIYTFLLCYFLLFFGMQAGALGPAMVDMTYIYDVSMDMLTITTSVWLVGYCLGALSAFLFRWINRQLANVILLAIGAALFAFLPYAPSVYVAYVFHLIMGYSLGILDTSQNVWFLEMWHENPNPVMLLSQSIYGVGTIMAPLIERPYLTGDDGDNSTDSTNSTITPEQRRENLTYPFALFGGMFMLGVIALLFFYIFKRYVPPSQEVISKKRDAPKGDDDTKLFERENAPKFRIIGLSGLSLGTYCAVQNSFFSYSATFAQKLPLKVSASEAATIQSVLAAAFTLGRTLNFFIAMKLRPRHLLIIHYTITIVSLVALLFSGESLIILWVTNITMGYGMSAMMTSTLTFTEEYVIINDAVAGPLMSFSGAFSAIIPYLIGLKIDTMPMILIYLELGMIAVSVLMHIVIRFMIRSEEKKSSRITKDYLLPLKKNLVNKKFSSTDLIKKV